MVCSVCETSSAGSEKPATNNAVHGFANKHQRLGVDIENKVH